MSTPIQCLNVPLLSRPARLRGSLARFFTGEGLPSFLVAATLVYEVFLILVLVAPVEWGPWGAFAEDFKVWCFNYDPRTGGMEWMSVAIMMLEPVFIVALVLGLWRFGAGGAWPRWGRQGRALLAGAVLGAGAVGGLFAVGRPAAADWVPPPFPGERIRTRIAPPDFDLMDHRGAPVALADLRGRATLVTGVYAMCAVSCPEILIQVKELLDGLPAAVREHFGVVAMSLNPEYDTAELMGAVAEGYGYTYPEFRYLNGDVAEMSALLRDLQFAVRRNPDTGMLDHANLFILLDAEGRIAYRFNLDRRHRGWLVEAVKALAAEAAAGKVL